MTLILGIILPTVAQKIPAYVPTNGLVGWWPFNGNANDESGNNNNGTVNGAKLTADRNGIVNSAYSFDGVDDYIESKNAINLTGNLPRTISLWFNINTYINGWSNIINFGQPCPNNNTSNSLMIEGSTEKNTRLIFKANGTNDDFSYTPISDKIWYNFVWSFDGVKSKIYLNSINYTNANKTLNTTLTTLKIGFDYTSLNCSSFHYIFNKAFNGSIDDIAIYNRALTQEEITNLYKGCSKETATSSSFNSVVYTTNGRVNLSANPTGGIFKGDAVTNNAFDPTKGKLGKNQVKYNFKNSSGCSDSTNFAMILVDTVGNKCSTYDTLKIKVKLTTGINKDQYTNVTVYPNPTSDILVIVTPDEKILSGYKYRILDIQGKEVYNASISTAKTEIDINKLGSKGVYILHIVDANGTSIENKKIVLE